MKRIYQTLIMLIAASLSAYALAIEPGAPLETTKITSPIPSGQIMLTNGEQNEKSCPISVTDDGNIAIQPQCNNSRILLRVLNLPANSLITLSSGGCQKTTDQTTDWTITLRTTALVTSSDNIGIRNAVVLAEQWIQNPSSAYIAPNIKVVAANIKKMPGDDPHLSCAMLQLPRRVDSTALRMELKPRHRANWADQPPSFGSQTACYNGPLAVVWNITQREFWGQCAEIRNASGRLYQVVDVDSYSFNTKDSPVQCASDKVVVGIGSNAYARGYYQLYCARLKDPDSPSFLKVIHDDWQQPSHSSENSFFLCEDRQTASTNQRRGVLPHVMVGFDSFDDQDRVFQHRYKCGTLSE
ncbi:hypothetical protein SAMN05660463_02156 [Pseudomonas sp. URIL14HWK12:I9]|nr:hypothetical protein F474_01931 [Pseudomonas sp. URIL14HWK12:I12]PVZ25732.1 hypothetical protein F470_01179 [Pseudomonas sp. URIL14HWK12:I10]PVZ36744.1 hypothetical protein F472_01931 [Pseudomonas sp. URIL14HWK12:I11]SNZ12700.1 hypothetical protein SAMN05660463_02156 [Pseudomonas sp. URIL14HWK12:I9]